MIKEKDLIFLAAQTFVTVLLWIIFSIYHNVVTSTIPEALKIQITPISPTFDSLAIDGIKKRERVSPLFEFSGFVQLSTVSAKQGTASAKLIP